MANFQSLNDDNWVSFPAEEVKHYTEEQISELEFCPVHTYRCRVPGTVLSMLIDNGIYPDPFVGQNSKAIPDIGDAGVGPKFYTYWFRRIFSVQLDGIQHHEYVNPSEEEQRVWLELRGINYHARIYLNGRKVGWTEGMFLPTVWDITDFLIRGGKNQKQCLAILVEPPPHHGVATGEQGGDHAIGQDVTNQFTAGWDWIIPVADRNTGLWDSVGLRATGAARLAHAWARAAFPAPACWDTITSSSSKSQAQAEFSVQVHSGVQLTNGSSEDVTGQLLMTIYEPDEAQQQEQDFIIVEQSVRKDVTIPAKSSLDVELETIELTRPFLWWPNGSGKQPLYKCIFSFSITRPGYDSNTGRYKDAATSDTTAVTLGVRDLRSHVDEGTGGRVFAVNGRRVFIRGGNWTVGDARLRYSDARYGRELHLWRRAGLNMVRVWGGGILERPEFYSWCDQYGLLVWQDFWVTGDNFGRGGGDSNFPLDHDLFLRCAESAIRSRRCHPSLALWCGGNEQRPAPDLDSALEALVGALDPGRLYVPGSVWSGFAGGRGGAGYLDLGDGPYAVQDPRAFFRPDFYPYGFNPEIGSVGVPCATTMKRFLRNGERHIPDYKVNTNGFIQEEVPALWEHHKYISYGDTSNGVHNQVCLYGIPTTLDEFCEHAQFANYVQYRALLEAWGSQMWEKFTGMLIWKVQNPWTGLRGQLYDCFLEPTGGLYGCMLALEPLHIQLNLETAKIEIINSSQSDHERLCIRASVLRSGGSGEEMIYAQDNILVEANRKWCSTEIPTADLKGAVLLFMDLFQEKHGQGEVGNGNYADQYKCNHSSVGKSSGSSWEVWLPIGIYQKATGTAEELINTKIKVADGWSALMPSINQTDHISRNVYWQPEELFKTSTPTSKIGCGHNIFAGVSQRMGIGSIQASPICPAADFRVFKQWLHSSSVTPSTGESFQLDFEVSPFFGAVYNSDSLSNNSTTSGSIVQITNSHTDKYAMWVRVDVKVIKCDIGDRQSVTDLAAEPSVSGDKEEESKAQQQNIIGNDIINHNISDADAVFMAEFFPVIKPGEIINIYIMKHCQCCGQKQHFQNHQGPNTAPLLKVVISGLNIARSEICI